MPNFEAVTLAAGMGTRLGHTHPKPLTRLDSGESIMRRHSAVEVDFDLVRANASLE